MGNWGVGIFSNDDGADVREDFRELVANGLTPDEATSRLQEDYGVAGLGADANDFWLALAVTQHKVGHVVDHVVQRALAIIDDPAEMERWAPADRRRRAATLTKLKSTLTAAPPPPKRLRTRPKVDTGLEAGQHVVVPLRSVERRVLLRITGVTKDRGGRYPGAVAVDWDGTERQLLQANRLPALLEPIPDRDDEALGFVLIGEPTDPDYVGRLPLVSDSRTPTRKWQSGWVTRWSELDRFFQTAADREDP